MTTKKFSGPSPYTLSNIDTYPKEDYVYTQYLNNVNTTRKFKQPVQPVVSALFGIGRAGSIHLENIARNPRIILKYIVDECVDRFDEVKQYWSLDNVIFLSGKDADRVYKDTSVKAVFVACPTHAHKEVITKSIENGKDVFCEKPIAQNITDTQKCYETADKHGKALYCAFNHRWDPSLRSVAMRVRNGEVGHVHVIKITARDSQLSSLEYLKPSGGIFHDSCIHDFDMTSWLLGELPCRVQAYGTANMPEVKALGDYDTTAYMLMYPSGTVVLADNSRYSTYGFDQRFEVFGNKGMIKVENERPHHSTETFVGQAGVQLTPIFYSFPSRYKESYKGEVEHFLDVVQYGVPMDVKSWHCFAVSKIATAVEKSARTGQSVDIDWSGDNIPAVYS